VLDVPEGGNLPSLTESFHEFCALVSLGNISHNKLFFIHPVCRNHRNKILGKSIFRLIWNSTVSDNH
jgi:hypothetical protein